MTTALFIPFRHSRLRYHVFGSGPNIICCFHGYGEDGTRFRFLEPDLNQTHTLYAIEMPFHGETEWHEPLLFQPADLMSMINTLVSPRQSIQLLGYSMGGRVCLRLLELFPERFNGVVVVAPDGLHKNPWQKLSTQSYIGNRLFRWTMQYPGWMLALMNFAVWLGLFNKSIQKFAHHYLDNANERKLLYRRWTTMRHFRPVLPHLKQVIRTHQIPVQMLFGTFDRVIIPKHGYAFQKNMEAWVTVREIEAGHHLLQEKYKKVLLEMMNNTGSRKH